MGSFLGVLSSRYSDRKGFAGASRGRSRCDYCRKTLRWYELVPLVSFLIQLGKCRSCKKRLSWRYPLVETLSGLIAVGVPLKIGFSFYSIIWILVFWILIAVSLTDLRLKIIPNPLVVLLTFLGITNVTYGYFSRDFSSSAPPGAVRAGMDLLGHYSLLGHFGETLLLDYLIAVICSFALFGGLYFFTRGRAMGFGDVKLASAFGFLAHWPDIIAVLSLSFIVGSLVGLPLVFMRKFSFKTSIPFGPFLALGLTLTFFFGYDIISAYFRLFGLA